MDLVLANQQKQLHVQQNAHQENTATYLDKLQLETHVHLHAPVDDMESQQVKQMKVMLVHLHAVVADGVQQRAKLLNLELVQIDAWQVNIAKLLGAHQLKIRVSTIALLDDTHRLYRLTH